MGIGIGFACIIPWMCHLPQRPMSCFLKASSLLCLIGCCALAAFGQAPPNDHFTNAIALSGNVVTFSGTLSNATIEDWEPEDSCSYDFFGPSVWWSWTATQSTAVVVETLQHSPTYGSAFAALKGTEIWALTPLDCNFMDPITNRYLSFLATSGTTYYIRVFGNAQAFTLRLTATNSPMILAQPRSTTLPAGSSAWFGVVAGGLAPLQYQWPFEGANLPGQTAPLLLVDTPGLNRAGGYS